jgi:small-conductance mechanosensitive channel
VDKVDGASVTIAGQVVCTDSGRWPVQREFNRRMKRRFQELGIRIFNPLQPVPMLFPGDALAGREEDSRGGNHGRAQAAD